MLERRDLVLSGLFMLAMFVVLFASAAMASVVASEVLSVAGFVFMGLSMVFWCKFALPLMGK